MNKQDWTYKKLGEVATIVGGSTPKSNIEEYWGGTHYWVTPADLDGNKYQGATPRTITDLAVQKTNLQILPIGTVLLSSRAPIGKVAITTVPMYCNQGFKNIICSDLLLNEFVYWFLYGKVDYLNSLGRGATFKEISKKTTEQIPIPVPPLAEQERIVAELDLLSGIIDKKKEQLKAYDQLAQSIFYTMFGDPIDNPKGWETKKLGDISSIGTGATPSREKEELYYGGDISWVKTTEVQNCDITKTEETITQMAIEQTNCRIYPPDTLLMAMYGQGKTRGQIAKLRIHAATNQACAAISLNFNICNLDYIYELLRINYDYIRAMAQGGNQANLNMKLVASIPIILPPLSVQQEFAEKVESIERQKALIRQSIDEVQTMFDYTMDKYFG